MLIFSTSAIFIQLSASTVQFLLKGVYPLVGHPLQEHILNVSSMTSSNVTDFSFFLDRLLILVYKVDVLTLWRERVTGNDQR